MTKTESIFLDLVRFAAAILVFLQHAPGPQFAYWLPWTNLGHISVMIFFVLSGFVIAYVTNEKENSATKYFAARFSRIYSILIPCLILNVAVLLYIFSGSSEQAIIFQQDSPGSIGSWPANTICSFLSANQTYWCQTQTPINLPLWSISYEVCYYLLFGVLMFTRGAIKWIFLFLIAALIGPKILLLFPVWLMGVLLYKIKPLVTINTVVAWLIFISAPACYLFLHYSGLEKSFAQYLTTLFSLDSYNLEYSKNFLLDYIWGALIVLVFISFFSIQASFSKIFIKYEKPIRACAKYTFSIYVFHFPLLYFFAIFLKHDPNSIPQGILLMCLSLGGSVALGMLFETNFRFWLKTKCVQFIEACKSWAFSSSS